MQLNFQQTLEQVEQDLFLEIQKVLHESCIMEEGSNIIEKNIYFKIITEKDLLLRILPWAYQPWVL